MDRTTHRQKITGVIHTMTNEQLAARIRAGEDVAGNMAQLYDQVKDFIHSVAWKYKGLGELEDLEQEGFLALYDAIDHYEADQGVRFLSYAEYWIRQRIQRYLQMNGSCLRLPVNRQEVINKYKRFCSSFQMEQGREPSEAEIALGLWLTVDQVRKLQLDVCMGYVCSLDAPVRGKEGEEDSTLGDLAASACDLEGETVDRMDYENLCSVLWECVDSLPGKQPAVIRSRYQRGLTLGRVGEVCGITEAEARKQHMKALRALRNPENANRLRRFIPEAERIYSSALIGNGAEYFNRTWTSSTERVALGRIG